MHTTKETNVLINAEIERDKTGRIEYIDIAKGIGMILVVVGHCIDAKTFPGTWIYCFHMPLFFVLSGLCFNDKKYPTFLPFLKKRIKTLFLPCIYFSLIITVLSVTLFNNYHASNLLHGFPGGLWFVFVLFISELFYWFINRLLTKHLKGISLIVSFVIGYLLNKWQISLPYSICSIFVATFFYGLGHLCKDKINFLTQLPRTYAFFIGFLLLIIPGVVVYFKETYIGMSVNAIPNPALLYCLIAISGTLGTLTLCTFDYGKIKRIFLFIGKNTLTILGTHIFFINLSSHYISPLIGNYLLYKISEQMVIWMAVVICCYVVNKKAPWMIGK